MNICAVIVTYNRLKCLIKALNNFENQTLKPNTMIIVNNNSTDGTKEFLKTWSNENLYYKRIVLNLNNNIGGSGGFYEGIKESLKYNPDWIWVSDDDAYPYNTAFEKFDEFLNSDKVGEIGDISVISGRVVNNGLIDENHRRRLKVEFFDVKELRVNESEYNRNYFQFNIISYVGSFINKKSILKVGLPERDFFIYYDDTEHSIRLNQVGKIICVPEIQVEHNVEKVENDDLLNWKMYYGYRNKLITFKKHFSKMNCFILILRYIKNIIFQNNNHNRKIYFYALIDGIKGKTGISKIIKPGWKG